MNEELLYDAFVLRYILGLSISKALEQLGLEELVNHGFLWTDKDFSWLQDVDVNEVDKEIERREDELQNRYNQQTIHHARFYELEHPNE